MTEATQRTSDSGVSIWLDDLSRSRIESGSLQDLIANKNVVGVTTNPSIFQKALHEVGPYDPQLKELGKVDVETAVRELTTTDVRNATDIFREIAEKTDELESAVLELKNAENVKEESFAIRDTILGKMAALRAVADEAETQTSSDYWPFPTYGELLFGVK